MLGRRVVVTGLGMVAPLGNSVAENWEGILKGKSGVSGVRYFDATDYPVRFACSVNEHLDISEYLSPKDQRKMDSFIHYGIIAGLQAFKDSGIEVNDENSHRIGISIGSGIGGLPGIQQGTEALLKGGPRRVSPFFVPKNIVNMCAGNLSIMLNLKGPNIAISTACTTGTHSIGEAARAIAYGDVDVMLAGGAENATSPMGISGFAAAKALSTRNDDPQTASRPWDVDRDGFVLGDGAGVLVLEEYEHAKARGASIYAELIGYGRNADAFHMTQPSEGGVGAARCMQNALFDAKINPDQINYVNAHGTSTPAGDIAETLAAKAVFKDHAKQIKMSSTKSMTGHLLGAAGGIEAIFSVLAIRDQVAPPTINIFNQDPLTDLDHVPWEPQPMEINRSLSNSFGFGGTNGTLIFAKL